MFSFEFLGIKRARGSYEYYELQHPGIVLGLDSCTELLYHFTGTKKRVLQSGLPRAAVLAVLTSIGGLLCDRQLEGFHLY